MSAAAPSRFRLDRIPTWAFVAGLTSAAVALVAALPPLGRGGLLEPDDTTIALAARGLATGAHASSTGLGRALTVAVGASFHLFGVHAWSARLPSALALVLALLVSASALTRLVGRRAGVYALLVLATTPLAVAQGRALTGGALGLLAVALAWSGVALAWFGPRGVDGTAAARAARVERIAWGALGAVGIAAVVVWLLAQRGERPTWSPRFDEYAAHALLALAPWSAVLPLAIGRVCRPPTIGRVPNVGDAADASEDPFARAAERRGRLGAFVIGALLVMVVVETWLAREGGVGIFAGAPLVAALMALALVDLDADDEASPARRRAAEVSTWELATAVAGAWLLHHAVEVHPEALLAGHGVVTPAFPAALAHRGETLSTLVFALPVLVVTWGWARATWRRRLGRWTAVRFVPPGVALGIAGLVGAAVLGIGLRPAVASELSPAGAFEAYAALRSPGDPLGLVGLTSTSAELYGPPEERFGDPTRAGVWLAESPPGARRFLVTAPRDLPQVNEAYRARRGENVPVLGPPSSSALLVGASPVGAPRRGPLDDVVLHAVPPGAHPVHAELGHALEIAGYEVVDERGRPVTAVRVGHPQRLRIYYRVLQRVPGAWTAFVHIDGHGRRHNGDHPLVTAAGGLVYPPNLWLPGDVIVDESDLTLERSFAGGAYTLFVGFFAGDTRMPVTQGKSDGDNRVIAGTLRVE